MKEAIRSVVLKHDPTEPEVIRQVGMGYYADVFRFGYKNKDSVIIKVYKNKGMMKNEVLQLKALYEHTICPVPAVLWTHNADDSYPHDILAMTYIKGTVGGLVKYINPKKKRALAENIIDCLLAFHNTRNNDGFGEIASDVRYNTFNECYRLRAQTVVPMAEALHQKGEITNYVLSVIKKAIEKFDKVFYLPITEASLIHGDYNVWNIMVDKRNCKVSGIIDPCGCMWADNEFDLYQLFNANGKKLGLFEHYRQKKGLSENYKEKMAFYQLFTEIEHYYNSGHSVKQKKIKRCAEALDKFLD